MSQLICFANQLTGFYMVATLALKKLMRLNSLNIRKEIWRRFLRRFQYFCIQYEVYFFIRMIAAMLTGPPACLLYLKYF